MQVDYKARADKLRELAGSKADVVALVPGANMVYFTGLHFHLSERPIIAMFNTDGDLAFIIPELEMPKLHARPDLEARAFMWSDKDGYEDAFRAAVQDLGLGGTTLGVDGMTMRVSEWLTFQQMDSSIKVQPVERELIRIRSIKSAQEVEAMRRAIKISEAALDRVLDWVQPGMTEREIAGKISQELIDGGCEGNAFEPLVQTGPNSAFPHGFLTERALLKDEFLLIDYGGLVDGYPSDITRTFCLGNPTDEMRRMYDVVLRANRAAAAVAGPGVAMGAVDKAARDVITEAGLGPYFIHRTGHGLGLDGHEPIPQIATGVDDLLEVGMSFTIEPGVYIPGLGGCRIEDNVVVTEGGIDVLTSYPRQLTR